MYECPRGENTLTSFSSEHLIRQRGVSNNGPERPGNNFPFTRAFLAVYALYTCQPATLLELWYSG